MDPLHYIDASINLATEQRGKPRQVYLRRAISTAYYGMFHTVSKTYADALIGTSKTRNDNAWLQAYRSLVHSQIARCSNRTEIRNQFSSEMQKFFYTFSYLHSARNDADYNPYSTFYRSQVLENIELAKDAINDFLKANLNERKAFVAFATSNPRKS